MFRFLCFALIAASPLVLSPNAYSQENMTSLESFKKETRNQYLKCDNELIPIRMGAELNEWPEIYSKFNACKSEARTTVKALFPAANAAVAKKPAASGLLKDFYAAWLSQMDAMSPSPDERKSDYEARQQEAELEANKIWNRFEIEVSL